MKTPPLNQPLSLSSFDEPLLCIVHIASQHPATLHQVVLRQDKVSAQGRGGWSQPARLHARPVALEPARGR